jgi:hypothetical protein
MTRSIHIKKNKTFLIIDYPYTIFFLPMYVSVSIGCFIHPIFFLTCISFYSEIPLFLFFNYKYVDVLKLEPDHSNL